MTCPISKQIAAHCDEVELYCPVCNGELTENIEGTKLICDDDEKCHGEIDLRFCL